MPLRVQLLGRPRVGGASGRPPARKSWALLAYLILHPPVSRRRLAELLFADADDPLGALRWSLSDLRRALGSGVIGTSDPVHVEHHALSVDVTELERANWSEAVAMPGFGRELLEGVDPASDPAFELWLMSERRRIASLSVALLHEAALGGLAMGEPDAAVRHANLVVEQAPDLDDSHALLIRCLVAAGRPREAAAHAERMEGRFVHHGSAAGHQLQRALQVPRPPVSASTATIAANLEMGLAAVDAGALADGIAALEEAAGMARQLDDPRSQVDALLGLGSTLVHAARGNDEEGAALLHEAAAVAEQRADGHRLASIWRELGWIGFLRGEYERARYWLARSAGATSADEELAWISLIEAACVADQGDHAAALELLDDAEARADRAGDIKGAAFARSFRGRSLLLLGEPEQADVELAAAIDGARRARWVSVLPWPMALRSEVSRLRGDLEQAAELAEGAFALGCKVGDPCWEGLGARAGALSAFVRGDARPVASTTSRSRLSTSSSAPRLRHLLRDGLCDGGPARGRVALRLLGATPGHSRHRERPDTALRLPRRARAPRPRAARDRPLTLVYAVFSASSRRRRSRKARSAPLVARASAASYATVASDARPSAARK